MFWKSVFQGEAKIEKIRYNLKSALVNTRDAFIFLDRDCDGFIESLHLRDFLSMNGFFGTDREILGLMQRLDHSKSGRVSQTQFVQALKPKTNQHLV
jgi:Ca2+-binding EF-hand superfamily protein